MFNYNFCLHYLVSSDNSVFATIRDNHVEQPPPKNKTKPNRLVKPKDEMLEYHSKRYSKNNFLKHFVARLIQIVDLSVKEMHHAIHSDRLACQ